MQRNLRKNIIVIVILSILMVYLLNLLRTMDSSNEVDYSDFIRMVNSGQVTFVSIGESMLEFKTPDQSLVSRKPPQISNLSETLIAKNVDFKIVKKEGPNLFITILYAWLPVLLIVGVILMFSKQFQGGGKGIMGFSKFKPKKQDENAKKYTFDDVAGIEDAKQEVLEIVEYLKSPQKFNEIGAKIPKGVLLSGGPGTGKTLLAKAIAGEAGVPFFNISGSDFVEMFVGVGAARVRDLFENARSNSPCIVFIDEIDAVGRNRGSGLGGGNDEREQTLNQLLVEMDGFSGKEGIIVIAATNRPDVLDSALTRPGRLDRQVVVSPPDMKGRLKILEIHSKGLKMDSSVNLEKLAQLTIGFTGADLANLCNEAALLAGRKKKTEISILDFEDAWNKLLMGPERKTLTQSEQELKTTSYHEAGHALINVVCKFLDPLHKVSVVPRGRALGVSISVPDKESFSNSKEKLWQKIQMIMGGRAAEEIIFNHFTSGASNDLERATSIAHQMVCSWGMSEEIGPIYLSDGGNGVFLGREFMQDKMISDTLAKKVDFEVKKIVNQAYVSAKTILENHIDALHEIAAKLLKEETIEGSEVSKIVFKG